MAPEPVGSVLSREQLGQALAVLREVQQARPISAAERKKFFWYGISVWVFFAAFAAVIVCIALSPEGNASASGWKQGATLSVVLLLLSLVAVVTLFFWNLKLLWLTWREVRVAFSTRLWQLLSRARTRRRWLRRVLITLAVILLVPVVGIFLLATFGNAVIGSLFAALLIAVAAFFWLRLARRRLDRLGNADELLAFLSRLDVAEGVAGADQVVIPTAVFQKMGAIEDAHILSRRAQAMHIVHDCSDDYAVLKSRAFASDIARLDAANQLRVEAYIVELSGQHQLPHTARQSGGAWRIPVMGAQCEIVCREDAAAHRLELLSLEQIGDGARPARPVEEAPRG